MVKYLNKLGIMAPRFDRPRWVANAPQLRPFHERRQTLVAQSYGKAGGLIEGRGLARVVGLPGGDRSTQKVVRALMTGYLLYTLTGDKAYADFADPQTQLPKTHTVDPFADDPVGLEHKVAALLKV